MLNIDILYLIFKYLNIKYLGRISQILLMPYSDKKLKYYKTEKFTCPGCNNSICIPETWKIKYKDNKTTLRYNTRYYYCKNCQYYYLSCPLCSNDGEKILCQFLGFSGYYYDSHKYRFYNKDLINNILKKIPKLKEYLKNGILEFRVEYGDINNEKDCNYQDIIHRAILETYDSKYFFYSFHFYDVSDLNLEYFNISDCYPSGPYTDFPILWRCNNCLSMYEDT